MNNNGRKKAIDTVYSTTQIVWADTEVRPYRNFVLKFEIRKWILAFLPAMLCKAMQAGARKTIKEIAPSTSSGQARSQ